MSIDTVNDLPPRVQYVASAAQTVFPYPFPIFQDADLEVYVDGVLQALDTDYTVAGEGDDTGGDITFLVALDGGEIVTIIREIAIERDTDISQNGPWSSVAYNDEQDKIFLILQQLKAAFQRSLRIPVIAEVDDDDIEITSAFANMYLTFDDDLKPTPAALSADTMTRAIVGQLLFPTTDAEVTAGVTVVQFFYEAGVVDRYGVNTTPGTTDMSAAAAAAALVFAENTPVKFLPTAYMFQSQVTFVAPDFTRGLISGYGCEIYTTGAISAIKVQGNTDPHGVTVEGIKVNQRNNGSTSLYGFEGVGTPNLHFKDCVVEANDCQANYGGFIIRNLTPSDIDTGCFWAIFEKCTVRERSGSDTGSIPYGIILQGSCNDASVFKCALNATTATILIQPESGQTYMGNGILIDNNDLENGTDGILAAQTVGVPVSGLRVTNNRGELLTNFVSLTGATAQPSVPMYMAGNYLTPDITVHVNNPNNLYYTSWDTASNFAVGPHIDLGAAMEIRNISGTGDCLVSQAATTTGGMASWRNSVGTLIGKFRQGTAVTDLRLQAQTGASLEIIAIKGLSAGNTPCLNFAGSVTFASAATKAVTFANTEPDTNYLVTSLAGSAQETYSWETKTTGGFTIRSSNATSTAIVNWTIARV